jgi:hypothetical protein
MLDKKYQKIDSDLQNPRMVFNWGYHEAWLDITKNYNRQTKFCNQYYEIAYNMALEEYHNNQQYENDSTICWKKFLNSLSQDDLTLTEKRVRESIYRSFETLWVNCGQAERSRKEMSKEDKIRSNKRLSNDMAF